MTVQRALLLLTGARHSLWQSCLDGRVGAIQVRAVAGVWLLLRHAVSVAR